MGSFGTMPNQADRKVRNMNIDCNLSQDGSETGRKTNPTSAERRLGGSRCEPNGSLSEDRVPPDRPIGAWLPVIRCPPAGRAVDPDAPRCEENAECHGTKPTAASMQLFDDFRVEYRVQFCGRKKTNPLLLAALSSTQLDRPCRMRAGNPRDIGGRSHDPRPAPVSRRGLTGAWGSSRIRSAQSNHVDGCQINASDSVVPALASALAIAVGPSLLIHDVLGMQNWESYPGYGIPSSLT